MVSEEELVARCIMLVELFCSFLCVAPNVCVLDKLALRVEADGLKPGYRNKAGGIIQHTAVYEILTCPERGP